MNRRYLGWMLAVVVGGLWTTSFSARAADESDDVKQLAGTWLPKEANLGDNKIDQMALDTIRVVFEGDKYTIKVGDKEEKGLFVLDPKKIPKTMDVFPTSGDNNGKTFLAVYELAGDNLTICYSFTPTVRPENLEPASNTLLLIKFERMKP